MAERPSYEFSFETSQSSGSFGERFQNISRNYVPGYRSRSIGNYGVDTQVYGEKFYKTREQAIQDRDGLLKMIGQDILLTGTEGVLDPITLYTDHVRLVDVPQPPVPIQIYDSEIGDGYKLEITVLVQRMA